MHENVSSVVQELKEASKDLIGYQTGGESYCRLAIGSLNGETNIGMEVVIHHGKHPLFDVKARIVDLDEFNMATKSQQNMSYEVLFKNQRLYGNLIPDHVIGGDRWSLGDVQQRRFNIFWSARNGLFTQLLRLKKINNHWQVATRVVRGEEILFESITPDYLANAEEVVEW